MKRLLPCALTASALAMLSACGDDSSSGADEEEKPSATLSSSSGSVTCTDVVATSAAWLYNLNGLDLLLYPDGHVTSADGTAYGAFDGANVYDASNAVVATVDVSVLEVCSPATVVEPTLTSSSSIANVQVPASSAGATTPASSTGTAPASSAGVAPASSSAAVPASSAATVPSYSSPVKLGSTADATVPASIYAAWKPYHFVTLEQESTYYTEAAEEFGDVFTAAFRPAGRVIWSTQSTGYYKNQCQELATTQGNMKFRGCTVSEGIGYGMVLSYVNGDDDTYVRLWNYSRAFRDYHNLSLTPWITKSFTYNEIDNSSATDADLDIATSLILQYYKSGKTNDSFLKDALVVVNGIWEKEVDPATKRILSGDTQMWHATDPTYNLSYFAPVALRLFAMVDPNHDWKGVLDAMYEYIDLVQRQGTGVLPDWSNSAGLAVNPPNSAAGNDAIGYTYHTFNKESVRIPWRIAWDYYWFQDERALKVLKTLNDFIVEKSNGDPSSLALAAQYSWDPTKPDITVNTSIPTQWLAAWCATGIGVNQEWLDKCTPLVNDINPGNNGSSYFSDILLGLYSSLLNGSFAKPF